MSKHAFVDELSRTITSWFDESCEIDGLGSLDSLLMNRLKPLFEMEAALRGVIIAVQENYTITNAMLEPLVTAKSILAKLDKEAP